MQIRYTSWPSFQNRGVLMLVVCIQRVFSFAFESQRKTLILWNGTFFYGAWSVNRCIALRQLMQQSVLPLLFVSLGFGIFKIADRLLATLHFDLFFTVTFIFTSFHLFVLIAFVIICRTLILSTALSNFSNDKTFLVTLLSKLFTWLFVFFALNFHLNVAHDDPLHFCCCQSIVFA